MDLGGVASTETREITGTVGVKGLPGNIDSAPSPASANRITTTAEPIAPSDNSIAQELQGRNLVTISSKEIYRNARNFRKIFSGQIKSRPHVRREDLQASKNVMDSSFYKKNDALTQHLENDQAAIVQETNIKSALIHGPLGANTRDLILNRALKAFNKELAKDEQKQKSNIVIFCSNDIACDDTARRMLTLMPKSKDRLELASAMRVIRDDQTLNHYQKLETDDSKQNKPKIFFVNAHSIKAKIKKEDDFDQTSKKLTKLTKILNLPELKYLYFTQAHELSTSVNDNLFDYLIRTINPTAQKTAAEQSKKENQVVELLGSTYYKPQRGSDADSSVNLEAYFSNTTIYLPSPNQLIVSGQMPSLDENKTLRLSTKVGEKIPVANGKFRTIDLKTDYLHDRNFLNGVVDEYINSFHSEKARNIISLERDEKSLQQLIDALKSKKIAFAVLTSEGLRRFDSEGNEYNDFKSRIEILDRLGKDYSLLVHYDEALLSGLEIPVDNQLLLCLPDISDDRTEAAISTIRTPYGQEARAVRQYQRGLLFVERSPHTERKHQRPSILELIRNIEKRHDDGKDSRGRFIANDHHHSNGKSANVTAINQSSGTTDKVSIKVEDQEWFEFLGEILGIENTGDYNTFAQRVEEEIDGYAEIILDLDQIELQQDHLNKVRVANILKGKEPYDKLKRDVIKAFINDKQRFIEAAVRFPHIVGLETPDEAIEKTKLEINNANLEKEFNSKWFAELNKVSSNKALSLAGTFLLEQGDQYGKPLSDDELLHSALRVIFGGQEKYNGSSENAKQLFIDFYNYVNQQYSLVALRVNQILTETEIGKDLKIDFNSSLNLNRPNDLYNNVLIALEDSSLLKNQACLSLLDQALGIKSLPDKKPLRAKLLSDYIQHSPLALGYLSSEIVFRNLLSTLLGNSPDAEYINSIAAKNIFSDLINFINSPEQKGLNKLELEVVRRAAPTLVDHGQQVTDLNSAQKYIRHLAVHANPIIEPHKNWANLVASCLIDPLSKAEEKTLNLIAEFLYENKDPDLISTQNQKEHEKNLKRKVSLLACHNPAGIVYNETILPIFAQFCDWLRVRNPALNPIQIHRQAASTTYYKPENRITNPDEAFIAIDYAMEQVPPIQPHPRWIEYLNTLSPPLTARNLFGEYLLSLRNLQPTPIEPFKKYDELRHSLSVISANGKSHDDPTKLKGFIGFLTIKYGNKFDIVKVRTWFPEHIEFRETIKTPNSLKTTVLNLLTKIFPTIESYPKFLQRFKTEGNTKLAEFLLNFLIPQYQTQIDSIQNENELNKLLRSLLGQVEAATNSPENTMVSGFVDLLLRNQDLDITEARARFPKQVSFAETITTTDLATKTVLISLNKVSSKVKADDRPKTLLKLFTTGDSQGKLAETIVNFLIPKYQGLFNQTADEAALETLLEFMLGINKKVPIQVNEKTLIENFIKQLIQDQKLNVIEARSIFPGYISFTETIATEGLATQTILNSLNDKIFTLTAPYSDFVKKLFANNPSNPKIAELVAKFLIPRYQNQIQNEASLEKLLQLMLKQNRNPATQNPETVIAKAFIEQMIQDQRIDIRDARSFFPEYINFANTVKTKDLAKKAINRSLDKIFSKRDYPRFWETIIDGELNNEKLAEFLVNFFFTIEHQYELQQIQNEEAFEQLLQSMLGLNKALQEEDPRTPLIRSFIDLVLEQKPEKINYVSLHPFYPHILDMSRETASFRLPPDEQLSLYADIIKLLILENQSEIEQNTKWIKFLDLAINNGEALTGENSFPGYILSTRSNVLADFFMKEHPEYLENDEELLRALGILLGVDVFIQNHSELTKTLIESLDQYLSNSINPARAGFRKEALSIFFPKQFPLTKEDLLKSLKNIFIDLFIEDHKRIRENGFNKATVTSDIQLAYKLADFIHKEFELNTKSAIQLLGKKPIEHGYHLEAYKDFLKRELVKNSGHAINQQTHEWLNALKLPLDEHQLKLTAMQTLLNESEDLTYLESLNRRYTFRSNDGDFAIKTFCECYLDRMVCFSWAENKSLGTKRTYNIKDNGWKLTEEVNLTNIDELPAYTKDYKFR